MSYLIILFGILSFFASIVCHVLVWRLLNPQRHITYLALIFLIIPLSVYGLLILYGFSGVSLLSLPTTSEILSTALLHSALAAAYIQTYPAMQARCPTLALLIAIKRSKTAGISYNELQTAFSSDNPIQERISDLSNSRMIFKTGSCHSITRRGLLLLWPLMALRGLLGLPTGKG